MLPDGIFFRMLLSAMPRSDDQRPLTFMVKEAFLEEITRACEVGGYSDRSQFIRDAVYEAMERLGMSVPKAIKAAPSRKGKGGRPKKSPPSPPA